MNEKSFTNKALYRGFEGGAVYTAEVNGEFLVIVDETTMADLLPEEDIAELELTKIIKFNTDCERKEYLHKRFGPIM